MPDWSVTALDSDSWDTESRISHDAVAMNSLRPVLRLRLEINAKRAVGHMEPHQIIAVRAIRPHHADQAAKGERCSGGNLGDLIAPLFSRLYECVAAACDVDLYT